MRLEELQKDELSSYEFLRLLFAYLVLQGCDKIEDDILVWNLWKFKHDHPEYKNLFYCFDFTTNLTSVSSKAVGSGILTALTFGLIHTRVPSNGYIYFDFNKKYAKEILNEFNNDNIKECFKELAQYFLNCYDG